MRLAVALYLALFLLTAPGGGSANRAHADEGPPKPDPVQVCEADNARLRAALEELARVLAKLGVAAGDAGAPRAGN